MFGTKPYFGLTGGWLAFWVSVACSTDMALFGYDQGVFGGVNLTPSYLETMGFGPTSSTLSTVTAIYDIGSFFGAIAAMYVGERLGRKKTILLGTSVMLIGAILQTSAFGVSQRLVARIVAGVCNGLNTATAPVWQAETSKASMQGKLVVIEMIFFMIVLYATVPWLPESPRWLMAHGYMEEAEQITADLEVREVDDPYIITVSKEMQWSIEKEREAAVPDLVRGRNNGKAGTKTLRRLILGIGTQAMQQLGGINVTSCYLPTVLEQSVGLDKNTARLLAACNSISYLIFGSLGIPVVENMGRRFLMLFSSAGQFVCYLLITVLIQYNEKGGANAKQCAEASIAFFFLYYVFFGFGWQGIPWLYPTEINSMGMRTRGAGLGTATNWIVNFMVVEITPPGIQSLGWQFYIIWTVFNFSFIPIVYLFYPETAGRSLEDMDRYYTEDPKLFVFRDRDATSKRRPDRNIEREQHEVRRHSSVNAVSAKTAAEQYRASVSEGSPVEANEKGL